MDLHFHDPDPTAAERSAVDSVLGPPASAWAGGPRDVEEEGYTSLLGGHAARSRRDLLLPALHAVQARFGWVPPGALDYICKRLTVPPAEAHGVVTFYHLFSLEPQPLVVAHVCDDIACRIKGAERLCGELEHSLGPESDGCWKRSPCLGRCESAPAALVLKAGESPNAISLAPTTTADIVAARASEEVATHGGFESLRQSIPQFGDPKLRLLGRIGRIDPEGLEAYRASGGYVALARAIELAPEGVIREVLASQLMGRGGAAFPTGRKWDAVAKARAGPRYVVCNADESEPGTFKDRALMEGDPFAVLEGMTIAGFATGSDRGYLYVRGEYPLATRRIGTAIAAARAAGLLGENVMNSGFAFDLELRIGAAPTSAAKRRPSSTRSKASVASRATSPHFRFKPDFSASRRSSTTWRLSSTSLSFFLRAVRLIPASARRDRPGPSSSAFLDVSHAQASSRWISASPWEA